jgi:ABC-2 type transport system ATP-binding protein
VFVAAIEARELTKRYGSTLALDRLNIDVGEGETYGFLGPNGAGKTTTIRLLLGLHRPSSGSACVAGFDAWSDPVHAHQHVAFVASEPALWPNLTGAEIFAYFANLHGTIDAPYRDLLIKRFDFDVDKKMRALSKGNRQKVQLIAAFATRSDILVLDEPTSGLDPLMEAAFRETVREARERGQTLFLSSHILSEVEQLCDRIGLLRTGRLIDEGTLQQLRHLSAREVTVSFLSPTVNLASVEHLDGVTVERVQPNEVNLQVRGDMGPLLQALADLPIVTLDSREPSLEEIFLFHYRDGGDVSKANSDGAI